MKQINSLLLTAAFLTGVASAHAGSHAGAPMAADAKKDAMTAASAEMADGEIRKVDKESQKITIKHGVIKSLDMPGMTMVFQVKDAAFLDKVKAGDKVRFSAEKSGSAIVVTDIQMAGAATAAAKDAPSNSAATAAKETQTAVVVSSAKPAAMAASADMSDGEIRKVDLESKKITLKHGPIKSLDMPGMTMVFQVKEDSLLSKAKAGDKVRFKADKVGSAFVVTDIELAK